MTYDSSDFKTMDTETTHSDHSKSKPRKNWEALIMHELKKYTYSKTKLPDFYIKCNQVGKKLFQPTYKIYHPYSISKFTSEHLEFQQTKFV